MENPIPIDRRFTFDITVTEDTGSKDTKLLTFQASDRHEYTQWTQKLGSSATGNHRVFSRGKTGAPPGLPTLNLEINDHAIGTKYNLANED